MTDVSGSVHKNDIINKLAKKKVKPEKIIAVTFNFLKEITVSRIAHLLQLFSELDRRPWIVCLQEVAKKQWISCEEKKVVKGTLGEFAAELGYKAIFKKAKGKALKGEFIGMLYDDTKLMLVTYGLLDARTGTHAMAAQANSRVFQRQPLLAVFKAKLPDGTLGQPFVVVTYHLICGTLTERAAANEVMWLNATLRALNVPKSMFILIHGDTNVAQDNEQWKFWHKYVQKGDDANIYMHLPPTDASTMTSGTQPEKCFDSALVRRDQQRPYLASSKVLYDDGWPELSNHYPVLTEFNAPGHEASEDDVQSNRTFLMNLKNSQRVVDEIGTVFHLEGLVKPKPSPLKPKEPLPLLRRSSRRRQS